MTSLPLPRFLTIQLALVTTLVAGLGVATHANAGVVNGNTDGIAWSDNGSTVTVTGCDPCSASLDIPSTLNGHSVTAIGDFAFFGKTTITEVDLPSSLERIGEYAFYDASGLSAISLPASLESIGNVAFYNATGLTSINIPASVTSIGNDVFGGATSLTAITVDAANADYSSATPGVLFDKQGTTLFQYPAGNTATAYTVPSGVSSIDSGAFYNAGNLTDVTIADSVESIGGSAFRNANRLARVTLGSGVTSVGELAFSGATSLTRIDFPDSVANIGGYVLDGATSLQHVTLPTNPGFTGIGTAAFRGTSSLTAITIPDTVTSIGNGAFNGASGLTTFTIPDSVTSIGGSAFEGASGLTTITVPGGVTDVGPAAFANMTGLTRIEFLGSEPSCDDDGPCTNILDSTPATVYRFATATGWPAINETYQGRPQDYLVLPPSAPTAVAGNASATITVAPAAIGPAPNSYTVTAVGDRAAACTISAPFTTCTINGLTNGTAYAFTAVARTTTPTATSRPSDASAPVTPMAPADPNAPVAPTSPATSPQVPALLPPVRQAEPRQQGGAVVTSGIVPDGATRVVQLATGGIAPLTGMAFAEHSAKRVRIACPISAKDGTRRYTCAMRLGAGRWTLTTQAMAGPTVIAQTVTRVRVRPTRSPVRVTG